jgi:hypothetical protein
VTPSHSDVLSRSSGSRRFASERAPNAASRGSAIRSRFTRSRLQTRTARTDDSLSGWRRSCPMDAGRTHRGGPCDHRHEVGRTGGPLGARNSRQGQLVALDRSPSALATNLAPMPIIIVTPRAERCCCACGGGTRGVAAGGIATVLALMYVGLALGACVIAVGGVWPPRAATPFLRSRSALAPPPSPACCFAERCRGSTTWCGTRPGSGSPPFNPAPDADDARVAALAEARVTLAERPAAGLARLT